MNIPENLMYTRTHERVKILPGRVVEIGITDFAQKEMGDIVFVDLPAPGERLERLESFADVESVKAVSEVFSPVTGVVKEVNPVLTASPELLNQAPYDTWLVRVGDLEDEDEKGEASLTAPEYAAYLRAEWS